MNDLKFALRQLIRSPGFSLLAVTILALGIGANTAMFSLVNALLFKPLAIERPDELVRLHSRNVNPDAGFRGFSYPNYADIRGRNDVFRDLTAFTVTMVGVSEGDTTRRVFATAVAANYFQTFAVRPAFGRDFLPEEERPGAGLAVAIVSHGYWKRHGADPELIGQMVKISGRAFQIVGVAPEGFTGTSVLLSSELYVPLGVQEWLVNDFMNLKGRRMSDRDNHCLMVAGRLKAGLDLAEAEARLEPIAAQLRDAFPKENEDQTLVLSRPSRLSLNTAPSSDREIGGLAMLLLPMAGVVLLVACLNLGNLLFARGIARQKEFAIRSALGGGRMQIIRQLVSEGLILSLAGGAVALLISVATTHLMIGAFGSKLPSLTIEVDSRPDVRVLGATFFFCAIATLLATLLPALRLSKVDVMRDLKQQAGEGGHDGGGRRWLSPRNLLVTGQIALAFVLLAVAGLFYRGALNAAKANPGFRFEQGALVELDASLAGYDQTRSRQVYGAVLERMRQLPGVQSASLATSIPFGLFSDGREIGRPGTKQARQEGRELADDQKPVYAQYTVVSDDYFRSLGTAMLRGREFNRLEADGVSTSARVAILNEAAAARLWPGEDAVGRQLEVLDGSRGPEPLVVEVIGLAPGFKASIGDQEPSPALYLPLGQAFQSQVNLHVRLTESEVAAEKAMLGTLRSALREVDDQLPVLSVNTLREFHSDGMVLWLFKTGSRLFLAFAGLALLLAVTGVYGVKAFVVARRTREFGIRMALGATKRQVLWMVLREGLQTTGGGLAIGLLLALAAGQLMRSLLFGVSGADPLSFGVALVVLGAAALLASYLPARHATTVEPMAALREE